MGYVYFFRHGDRVKIGYSRAPFQRLKKIERLVGSKLSIGGIIRGTYNTENTIHRRFESDRVNHEWFRCSPAIESFIEDRCHTANRVCNYFTRTAEPRPGCSTPIDDIADAFIAQHGDANRQKVIAGIRLTAELAGLRTRRMGGATHILDVTLPA